MEKIQPNVHGVYPKEKADAYIFEDSRIYLEARILQVEPDCWLQAVSYDKKVTSCGTMGMGTPLSKASGIRYQKGDRDPTTEMQALDEARKVILWLIDMNRKYENCSAEWIHTWNNMETWALNIGRQPDLFS